MPEKRQKKCPVNVTVLQIQLYSKINKFAAIDLKFFRNWKIPTICDTQFSRYLTGSIIFRVPVLRVSFNRQMINASLMHNVLFPNQETLVSLTSTVFNRSFNK